MRTLKIPFREAHHITGRIVAKAAETSTALHRLPLSTMRDIEPRIVEDIYECPFGRSVREEQDESFGGTAPKNVRGQSQKMAAQAGKREILTPPCFLSIVLPCKEPRPSSRF